MAAFSNSKFLAAKNISASKKLWKLGAKEFNTQYFDFNKAGDPRFINDCKMWATTSPKKMEVLLNNRAFDAAKALITSGQVFTGDPFTLLLAASAFENRSTLPTQFFILEFFLSRWDVDLHDSEGRTLMHHMALNGEMEVAKFLLSKKANIDARDNKGKTPMHYAVKGRTAEVVSFFIWHKANVAFADKKGRSPLYAAIKRGHTEIVSRLIKAGALVNDRDSCGRTPLGVARKCKNLAVRELLISSGAVQ